jgi:hypothetical protein
MNLTQDWISQLKADANAILDVRTDDECNEGTLKMQSIIDIQGQGFITAIEQKKKIIMCTVVLVLVARKPANY